MAEVASISLDTSLAREYAQYLQIAPKIAEEEITIGLQESLLLLEREVKEGTPVGVGGGSGLRGSIAHELRGTKSPDLNGRVFSPLAHAQPVELGTKPHFPPIRPLQDWVEAKLGVPASESKSVAFLIARKISKKGTKGVHMFENAFTENTQQIVTRLDAAINKMLQRLKAGE